MKDEEKDDLTPPEVAVPDRLDIMAAELPCEYEGPWIAKLVRSFGGARGAGGDTLEDLFQTACAAAAEGVREACECGGNIQAFVKTAVRSALAKANRSHDRFTARISYAEDGPRPEDVAPRERLVEQFPDVRYRPSRRKRINAVRLAALLVSPPARAYWDAFRSTDGTERSIAKRLGTCKSHVHHVLAPLAHAEFAEALRVVKAAKGGAL